jgi:hypothetical protein
VKVRRWCLGLEKITKGPIYPVDWIDVKCSSYPIHFIQCIKLCGGLTGTNFNHLKDNQQERKNKRRNILVSRSPTTKSFTLKLQNVEDFWTFLLRESSGETKLVLSRNTSLKSFKSKQTNSKTFIFSPLYPPPTLQKQSVLWKICNIYW